MTEFVTLGESLVAFRSHGRLAHGGPVSASAVGAELNVAIGLARLGRAATWIGVVGDDPAGDLVVRTLRAEGVVTDAVVRDGSAPTAVMLVDMPTGLPPSVTYHRSASAGSRLDSAMVLGALGAPRILHVTGITPALSAGSADAVQDAIAAVRAKGAMVSFDVNYRSKLWGRAEAARALTPIARNADILIASEDELPLVAEGADEKARVASLLDAGVGEVVIKRGRRGAEHFDSRGATSCAPHVVVEVNSIGAGDAFTAGYLSGVLDGSPVAERLTRGSICGALAVADMGDWEQAPTLAELEVIRAADQEASR